VGIGLQSLPAWIGAAIAPGFRVFAAAAVLVVSGCGGGGDETGAPATNPPTVTPPTITAPSITTEPADLTVTAGSTASFSVTAAGSAPLAYQWQSSSDGASFANVSGANAAGYSFAATLPLNGARFRVVVSNSAGSATSAAARLTVTAAPVAPAIAVQPVDETVPVGARAVFSVAVTGDPSPSLQWQRSSDGGSNWSDIPGAGGAEHAPGPVASSDDGARFRVQASNGGGTVFSNAARLSVWNTSTADLCVNSDIGPWCSLWPKPQGNHLNGIARVDGAVMVAVGNEGVIIRSSDAGQSWQLVPRATARKLTAVAFGDANVGIAVGSNGTMLRSQDGGLTWQPLPFVTGNALRGVAFANANVAVAVGEAETVLRSVDGGRTWSVVTGLPPFGTRSAIAFNSAGVGLIMGLPTLRTTDAGATWATVEIGREAYASVAFADANRAVAVGTGPAHTSDAGLSWQRYPGSLAPFWSTGIAFGEQGVGVVVGDHASRRDWILRTTDGGRSWSRPTSLAASAPLNAVAFTTGNAAVAVGQYGVITRSTDGGVTWTEVSSRPLGLLLVQAASFWKSSTGLAVGANEIQRTGDGGRSWVRIPGPSPGYLYGVATSPDLSQAVAVGQTGTIHRSIDSGQSWTAVVAPPLFIEDCIVITGTVCPADEQRLAAVAFADANSVVAVGYGGRITRSEDGGQTWVAVASPVSATLNAISFTANGVGLAVGISGNIIRTTDGGRTWSKVAGGSGGRLFTVAFASPQVVTVGGDNGEISRSADGGLSWQPMISMPGEAVVRSMAWSEAGVGIAATSLTQVIDGISQRRLLLLRSTDSGRTWVSGPSLPLNYGQVVFTGPNAALVFAENGELWISTGAGQ
jgi:photosystem II stability/assembly factor-like uncharacterized protein